MTNERRYYFLSLTSSRKSKKFVELYIRLHSTKAMLKFINLGSGDNISLLGFAFISVVVR